MPRLEISGNKWWISTLGRASGSKQSMKRGSTPKLNSWYLLRPSEKHWYTSTGMQTTSKTASNKTNQTYLRMKIISGQMTSKLIKTNMRLTISSVLLIICSISVKTLRRGCKRIVMCSFSTANSSHLPRIWLELVLQFLHVLIHSLTIDGTTGQTLTNMIKDITFNLTNLLVHLPLHTTEQLSQRSPRSRTATFISRLAVSVLLVHP